MPEQSFTVQQAADRVGVTGTTVRNWSRRYASHLSAGANPPRNIERQYTARDINVLQFVASSVEQKRSHADIEFSLSATSFGDVLENNAQDAPKDDARVNASIDGAIAPHSPASTVEFPLAATELIVNRLDNVSDRLTALEARRTAAQWFAIGATVGGGLVVAGLLIAWLLLRG